MNVQFFTAPSAPYLPLRGTRGGPPLPPLPLPSLEGGGKGARSIGAWGSYLQSFASTWKLQSFTRRVAYAPRSVAQTNAVVKVDDTKLTVNTAAHQSSQSPPMCSANSFGSSRGRAAPMPIANTPVAKTWASLGGVCATSRGRPAPTQKATKVSKSVSPGLCVISVSILKGQAW